MDQPERPARVHREVVSFVRRSTRMNQSQEKAWAERADWLVEVPRRETTTSIAPEAHVDWPAVFGRTAPLVVEIGCGTGDALGVMADDRRDRDHVAFEVFLPAMASTIIKCRARGLTNVRLVDADGVEGLRTLFSPGQVAEVWTFFPDPWHKARHAKRRLVSAELGDLVACRLAPGGTWHIATDWEEYAEHCREVLDDHPRLVNLHDGYAPRMVARPVTKYEQRGLDAGRAVFDLTYGVRS
ncbi:tRNA (guanosine(46)-N7)-methyltransferase TrmB [Mariniluteicoccus endophyticus]